MHPRCRRIVAGFRNTILATCAPTPPPESTGSASPTSSMRVAYAIASGDQEDGKVLYLGPDRSGNLLEVVSGLKEDRTEVVIHAMRMRLTYEPFLRERGITDG